MSGGAFSNASVNNITSERILLALKQPSPLVKMAVRRATSFLCLRMSLPSIIARILTAEQGGEGLDRHSFDFLTAEGTKAPFAT